MLAIEDEYYEYWFENLYGRLADSPVVFFHFCDAPVGICGSLTEFRNPIHIDVFRLVSPTQAGKLAWLTDAKKDFVKMHPAIVGGADVPGGGVTSTPGANQPLDNQPRQVRTGAEGVEGLARALGGAPGGNKRPASEESEPPPKEGRKKKKERHRGRSRKRSDSDPEKPDKKKKKKPHRHGKDQDESEGGPLREELNKKTPPVPRLSALELEGGHKKKKKKRKSRGSTSEGRDRCSPSSSSSTGELFHSAALPRGMERLRRMHQKNPGRLASLSLLRMQELVHRAQGRGTAVEMTDQLPAVAMGYVAGVPGGDSQLAGAQDGCDRHRHAVSERPSSGLGRDGPKIQSAGAGAQAAELVAGIATRTGVGGRPVSGLQTGTQSSTVRGEGGLEDSERSLPPAEAVSVGDKLGTHERGDRRKRRRRHQGLATNQPTERRRQERERQRQERPCWSKVTLVEGQLELPALERALRDSPVDDQFTENLRYLLRDSRLHKLYGSILESYESLEDKRRVYEDFTSLMVEWSNHTPDMILKLLENFYRPLAREGGVYGDAGFGRVMGDVAEWPQGGTGRHQRAREGKLLGVVGTSQVREVFSGWEAADGGVYVGDGSEHFPTSIFRENYADNIAVEDAAAVLDGRPLYVDPEGFSTAAEVVEKFSVTGKKDVWTWEYCQEFMASQLRGEVSVSLVGVVLKMVLKRCPGHLGNICRMIPACARRQFRQSPIELLPIAVPPDTQVEIRLQRLLLDGDQIRHLSDAERASAFELAKECGTDAWLGLILAVLNALFCGGSRPLGKVMPHPRIHTPEQQKVIDQFRGLIHLWIEEDQHRLRVTNWEVQSQELGDFYTGFEVTKAYKLSWAAIAPHVPGPGEAGRVPLEETVAAELREFVADPDLLRIPDDELGEVRYSAPVLVESSSEYDLIVKHLVEAGMLEREVPAETVKVNGAPIYNGLFGVHKGWIDEGGGKWRRSLRLIVNLIPTNLLQRRMPEQASKSMGYAPMWGSMALLEDEVILAYGEDIKHCFHIFSPGPRWRGYFVISKEASGSSFNDGVKGKARPRVRSAPMGWANIVDFVQSSLEKMGSLAGIPATKCVKMGEPSPLLELSTPRQYHSFYVDNYDGFLVVARTDLGEYQGRPSDSQLELRRTFQAWNIGRDEKKAAEGTLQWVSLGAEQLGTEGLVGRKFKEVP